MWYSKYKDNLAHHHKEIFMSFFSLSIYNCETKANRLFLSGFHNIRLLSWSCHHCWASGSSLWRCRELIWSVHLIWLRWGNWFLVTMCLLFRTGASQGKKSSWKPETYFPSRLDVFGTILMNKNDCLSQLEIGLQKYHYP